MQLKEYGIALGIILALGAFALSILVGLGFYRAYKPYLDYRVAGPVTLSQEWMEIEPKDPLRPDRKVQYLMLNIAEPMITGNPAIEPTKEDGTTVRLEVQLVDQHGHMYDLDGVGGDGKTLIIRGMDIDKIESLPSGTVFKVVRLRTNTPLRCSSIIWRAYDPRDLK